MLPTTAGTSRAALLRNVIVARQLHTSTPRALPSLTSTAAERAKDVESKWQGTSTSGGTTKNFVGGQWLDSKTQNWLDVHEPVSTSGTLKYDVITCRSTAS